MTVTAINSLNTSASNVVTSSGLVVTAAENAKLDDTAMFRYAGNSSPAVANKYSFPATSATQLITLVGA